MSTQVQLGNDFSTGVARLVEFPVALLSWRLQSDILASREGLRR